MDGKGVYTWPDGKRYEGSYKNELRHGYGVFTWSDGRTYAGDWIQGKQHGRGVYKKDGVERLAEWKDG
eukprot:CAMPEP_0116871950 /NCGR_PEP_ID=MMETSP0463-20121206/2526_1 /TAXON_ID=181622 /ORGANISM="Strombidinopsis sp, Strain SopsisLIS2011" /LENGTH=67 /DNA_ID=CAMNT_0004511335 /DNA_START=738 /DNA_END=941 /DNA_ORIENTATION=-